MDAKCDGQTDTRTFGLIERIGPEGRFFESPFFFFNGYIFGLISGRLSICFIGTLSGRKGMDVWPVQRPLDQD